MRSRPKVFSLGFTAGKCLWIIGILLVLCIAGCKPKQIQQPSPAPPVKQSIFVLLPDPDGKTSGIEIKNTAGAQYIDQPFQAVRVERPDLQPSPPVTLDQAEVQRLFGSVIKLLPAQEVQFTLYFDEGRDSLIPDSEAQIPAILAAIQDRHSTAITVTGHTDMTGNPESNYQLGLKRAQRLADILIGRGIDTSNVFASSHGEADPLVKTARGVAEQRNRRVEIIVR